MSNPTDLKLPKWPFFLGDAALLAFAYFIFTRHPHSALSSGEAYMFLLAGVLGALLAVTPYLLEYRAAVKMVETGAMVSVISQIQNLEQLAEKIAGATGQWQGVQEHCAETTRTAKEIAGNMSNELAGFTEFLQKANDTERANLRLEIDKLRRAESEWLQIIVRLLDNTFALHQAAVRSGQAGLIEQLGHFQNACRDIARRVGLVPFVPVPDEPFDPQSHRAHEVETPPPNATVRETLATGYTFQGQLIRPALVALQDPASHGIPSAEPQPAASAESPIEEQSLL